MSKRLSIDSVTATNFGGLHGTRLDIPSPGLVVIRGANEAGKSTLSELMAWLLVGPTAGSKSAQRFGLAGDELRGSLTGTVDSDPFSVDASFKLNKIGVSTKSPQTFTRGSELDLEQWRRGLGGIDDQVFSGIYRLWGQELHQGDDVLDQLLKVGLGALGGSSDPWSAADRFETAAKKLATGQAAGHVSVITLERELDRVRVNLDEALRNIETYSNLGDRRGQLEEQLEAVQAELNRSARQRAQLETSLKVLAQVDELATAERELSRLDPLPNGWAEVVADMPRFESALEALRSTRSELTQLTSDFGQQLARLDPRDPSAVRHRVASLSLTDADTTGIHTAVNNIGHSREQVAAVSASVEKLRADGRDIERQLTDSLASIGVDRATLEAALLDDDARLAIKTSSQECRDDERSIDAAETSAGEARVALARTESAMASARDEWLKMGQGAEPVEWMMRPSVGRARWSSAGRFVPAILVAVLAVAAAVLGEWPLAIGALVVAGVIALWSRGVGRAGERADSPVIEEAAQKYREHTDSLGVAAAGVDAAERRCLETRESLLRHRAALSDLVDDLGLGLPSDPHLIDRSLTNLIGARSLLFNLTTNEADVARSVEQLSSSVDQSTGCLAVLDQLFVGAGLPEGVAPEAAVEVSGAYLDAAVAMRGVDDLEARVDLAHGDWTELTSPVVDQVRDRSLDWVGERAGEMAQLRGVRADVQTNIDQAKRTLDTWLDGDPELAALVADLSGPEDVAARLSQLTVDIESTTTKSNEVAGELRLCREEIGDLADESVIADLRTDQGSLNELQEELALESAANVLAAVIARQVAEEFERKHQPDVIKRTADLASKVADDWSDVAVKPSGGAGPLLQVRHSNSPEVPVQMLSTGARALLYLSLRLAMADHDGDRRPVDMPLLCDDPLVHLDDDRATGALHLLADAAQRRQVIVFTCHDRTVEAAQEAGAAIVDL